MRFTNGNTRDFFTSSLGGVGMWLAGHTRQDQPLGDPRSHVSSVKPVGKLFEIELPPSASAAVIRAIDEYLGIADDNIDSVKHDVRFRVRTQRHLMLRLVLFASTGVYGSSIRPPDTLILHTPPQHLLHGLFQKVRHRLQEGVKGMPLLG